MDKSIDKDIILCYINKSCEKRKAVLNGSGTTSMGIFLLGFFRLSARKCLEEIFLPTRLSRSFLVRKLFKQAILANDYINIILHYP